MIYLKIFEEFSKNDPIKEARDGVKTMFVLAGVPGVGKSTFIKNSFYLKDVKSFSSDDISLLIHKDPNIHDPKSGEWNRKRMITFMKTGQSFIYDTTGAYVEHILEISKQAMLNDYRLVFIYLVAPLETSLKQNMARDRQAEEDFIRFVYDNNQLNMKTYYEELKPASMYIVTNIDRKYKYYKYTDNGLMRRKSDIYK